MPFDGSGNFNRVMNWVADAAASIKIRADRHDQEDDNLASGLSLCLTKDGQSQPTANISWNGKKLVNLATPTAPTDAANKSYVDAVRTFSSAISMTGNDTAGRINFTGTGSPGLGWAIADISLISRASPSRLALNTTDGGTGTDVITFDETGHIHASGGTAAEPAFSFIGDTNSGVYKEADGILAFAVDGVKRAALTTYLALFSATAGFGSAYVAFNTSDGTRLGFVGAGSSGNKNISLLADTGAVGITGQTAVSLVAGLASLQLLDGGTVNLTANTLNLTGAMTVSSSLTVNQSFLSSTTLAILAAQPGGSVSLRPNGNASSTGEVRAYSSGTMTVGSTPASESGVGTGLMLENIGVLRSKRSGTAGQSHMSFMNNAGVAPAQVGSITSNGSATAYNTASDENLKDVKGGYDPLEAVAIIRADPVLGWTWKSSGETGVGWVAQKSYTVDPDLATPPEEPTEGESKPAFGEAGYKPWGIDYGRRTPYLWAALTWALDQIDALSARIETLEGTPA
jgi:hypothetical protein